MKVGDYVRIHTLSGQGGIAKLEKKDDICITDKGAVDKNNIIKSSPNIIDLIEVGDFITLGEGYYPLRIEELWESPKGYINIKLNNRAEFEDINYDKDFKIYSIVTKECFESMEYKIGE